MFCSKHVDRLKAIRNCSPAFIDGIVGSALKKDNVAKHQKTNMHGKAVNMELQPTRTIKSILTSTLLGKAFTSVGVESHRQIIRRHLHVGQGGNALH